MDKGGLNMVDFTILDKSLKATWVKHLQETDGSKWCSVFSSVISQYGGRFIFECNFDTQDFNLTTHVGSTDGIVVEHSPPTNVARVRFPDSASYVG